MKKIDLHWLVGLLEGEGSFMKGPPSSPNIPKIAMESTDQDVLRRAARLCGTICSSAQFDKRNPKWKPVYQLQLRGRRAVVLMKLLRPYMGKRRHRQIARAIK